MSTWKEQFPKDNIYFETEQGILYCGDSRDILPTLPKESIDLVLTDPPYNIGKDYSVYKDKRTQKDFERFILGIYYYLYDLLKDKSHLIFTCAQKQIWFYKNTLENIGFTFRHIAIWFNPSRKGGSYPGQWTFSYEPVMDFTKGRFRKLNNGNSIGYTDVWIENPPKNIKHPAKRPVNCWIDLVNLLSNPNDIVLDPFMGSGTTAIASEQLGRRWIGIELNPDYCEITKQRIETILKEQKENN